VKNSTRRIVIRPRRLLLQAAFFLLLLAGWLYLKQNAAIDACLDAGGRWNPGQSSCELPVSRQIANGLTPGKVSIGPPVASEKVPLDHYLKRNGYLYLQGSYDENGATKTIALDLRRLVIMTRGSNDEYFLAPLYVGGQKAASRVYLGLFSTGKDDFPLQDAYLLGDGVEIDKLEGGGAAVVRYRQYEPGEPANAAPTHMQLLYLRLDGGNGQLRLVSYVPPR